ncbi:hypothetical protein D3C81_929390 [compost metagenome]
MVQLVRGQAHHLPAGGEVGEHVGELELQGLELGQRLAELLAFLDIAQRLLQRGLGGAEGAAGDVQAAAVQSLHGVDEALAFRADAVARRNAHAFESDGAGRLRLPAHLVLVAAIADAFGVGRHQEAGDALGAVLAGARHDDQHVGAAGAGDEGLGAVQHVFVALTASAGAQARGVGAGVRFGQAVGGEQFAGDQAGQPLLLQRRIAERGEHPAGHVVDGDVGGGGDAAGGQLFEDQRRGQPRQAQPAVVLADVQAEVALFGGAADHVHREVVLAVPVRGVRRQLVGGEGAGAVHQQALFLGKVEIHAVSSFLSLYPGARRLISNGWSCSAR